ncbi:MAG: hypothetical protein JHC95_13620 [Solirubrobacteraceae bacterium]|nr:hypothetical protein [Solirubrobacteraceae bacterium]
MRLGAIDRLFADDYTAGGQFGWATGRRGFGGDFWSDDLLGQLRFDLLVAQTLVVPDIHIFDGVFFLARPPGILAAQVGREREGPVLPIEVRGRRASLGDSLADCLRREGSDHLNASPFKALGDANSPEDSELRVRLARQFGRTSVSRLDRYLSRKTNPADAVAAVFYDGLNEIGAGTRADELVGPLLEGWHAWLAEERHVTVRAWPKHRPYNVVAALEPLDVSGWSDYGNEAIAAVQAALAGGSLHRADISAVIAPLRARALADGTDRDRSDVERVDRWYSRGRYRALAQQHGCRCAIAEDPALNPISSAHAMQLARLSPRDTDPARIVLPRGVLSRLADLGDDEYRRLAWECRRELSTWWKTGDVAAMQPLADRLAQLPAPTGRELTVTQLVAQLPTVVAGTAGGAVSTHSVLGAAVGAVIAGVGSAATLVLGEPRRATRLRIVDAWTTRAGRRPT